MKDSTSCNNNVSCALSERCNNRLFIIKFFVDVYLYNYRNIWIVWNKSPPVWIYDFQNTGNDLFIMLNGLFSKVHSCILSAIIINIIIAAYRNQIIRLQFTWFSINLISSKTGLFETPWLITRDDYLCNCYHDNDLASRNMVEKSRQYEIYSP